jgi:hypothetical protein
LLFPARALAARGFGRPLGDRILFEEFYGTAEGQNGLRGIIGNPETKFPFKFECQFDHIQAIGAKVINEARAIDHLVGINNKLPFLFQPVRLCLWRPRPSKMSDGSLKPTAAPLTNR